MSSMPQGYPQQRQPAPIRFELATSLGTRASGELLDPVMRNCYIEKGPDGRTFVVKRPGTTLVAIYAGTGVVQGLFPYIGYLFSAQDNFLYVVNTPVANNNASGTAFIAVTPQWKPRRGAASCVFKNMMWVIGGIAITGAAILNDVWSSDDGLTWTQVVSAAPWGARYNSQLVVFNGNMYLIGGLSAGGVYLNDVWISSDGVTWSQLISNAPWAARASHSAVAFNNGIMLMGGTNGLVNLNDVWFSTDGTSWSPQVSAAGWAPRFGFGAVAFKDKLYVIGGYDSVTFYNDVWSTTDGITWVNTTGAAFASGREAFGVSVYNGYIWIVGGEATGAVIVGDVYRSLDGITWGLVISGLPAMVSASCVTFATPLSVSPIRAPTLWILGYGLTGGTSYYANINTAVSVSFAIPSPSGTNRLESCTANFTQYLVLKDVNAAYVFTGNVLTRVTDTNYPFKTVPGVVNLDETVYVMDPSGTIYGSGDSPLSWPSFNFLSADFESDAGVQLSKYKNYVVAFGSYTTQFFYDAGISPGPILRPATNLNCQIGCAFPYSVQDINDTLYWVGRKRRFTGHSVYVLQNGVPVKVSTPFIDRWIEAANTITSSQQSLSGHMCYILTISTGGVVYSFAMDIGNGEWFQIVLNSQFGAGFWPDNCASDGVSNWIQDQGGAYIYKIDPTTYQDAFGLINVLIVTAPIDGGLNMLKFCRSLTLIGDRSAASVTVSFSDDDYQTIQGGYNINMYDVRPRHARLGSFIRRAWFLSCTSIAPLRLWGGEMEVDVGIR